jgi:hypothetical protein
MTHCANNEGLENEKAALEKAFMSLA